MGRVTFWDAGHISREVLYTRKSVEDGMRLCGATWLVRRMWTLQDLKDGLVKRCPVCWDEVNHQSKRPNDCPNCYGTTFDGGYRPVEIRRVVVNENQNQDTEYDKDGVNTKFDVSVKMACEPIYHDGDVFAEVLEMTGTRVTLMGRIFQIDGPVKPQTLQGVTSSNNTEMTTNFQRMVVSQSAVGRLLLPTDARYTSDFWGVDFDLTINRDHVCDPPQLMNSDNQNGSKWQSQPSWP